MKREVKSSRLDKQCTRSLFSLLSNIAEKNANTACTGLMYEPTVPKKLQK